MYYIPLKPETNYEKKRRDGMTIMTEMLVHLQNTMRRTHLLYKTNLSYTQLEKYLTQLVSMGLVQENSKPYRCYIITDKGRQFLEIVVTSNSKFGIIHKDLEDFR